MNSRLPRNNPIEWKTWKRESGSSRLQIWRLKPHGHATPLKTACNYKTVQIYYFQSERGAFSGWIHTLSRASVFVELFVNTLQMPAWLAASCKYKYNSSVTPFREGGIHEQPKHINQISGGIFRRMRHQAQSNFMFKSAVAMDSITVYYKLQHLRQGSRLCHDFLHSDWLVSRLRG